MIHEQSSVNPHSDHLALRTTRSHSALSPRRSRSPAARRTSSPRRGPSGLTPAPAARQQGPSWSLRAAGLSQCAWSASQAAPAPPLRSAPAGVPCTRLTGPEQTPARSARVCPQPRSQTAGPRRALSPDRTPGDVCGRGRQADARLKRSNAYPGLSGSKAFSVPSRPWGFAAFSTAVSGEWGFSQRT